MWSGPSPLRPRYKISPVEGLLEFPLTGRRPPCPLSLLETGPGGVMVRRRRVSLLLPGVRPSLTFRKEGEGRSVVPEEGVRGPPDLDDGSSDRHVPRRPSPTRIRTVPTTTTVKPGRKGEGNRKVFLRTELYVVGPFYCHEGIRVRVGVFRSRLDHVGEGVHSSSLNGSSVLLRY